MCCVVCVCVCVCVCRVCVCVWYTGWSVFAGAADCGEVRLPARPQVLLAQGGQERRSKVHGLLVAGGGWVGGWVCQVVSV